MCYNYGMIKLKLPYPPSVNHYWGQVGNRKFIGKRGKEFREEVYICALNARKVGLKGRLEVKVYLYPPDKRKRDIDNIFKSLLDALEHAGVYENDSQIDRLCVERLEVVAGGCCVVEIIERTLESSPDC